MEDKTFTWYVERMGLCPCYMYPEYMEEDDEFEYYQIQIPRHYIRDHIEEGGTWLDYVETDEEGEEDASVVLGVIFLPVFHGVEYLDADADFLYYKVRAPKVFLETDIPNAPFKYREIYDAKRLRVFIDEDELDDLLASIDTPKAGEPMPGIHHAHAVRRVKEERAILYEVRMVCEECNLVTVEVGTDLFDLLSGRSCSNCFGTRFRIDQADILYEDDDDNTT